MQISQRKCWCPICGEEGNPISNELELDRSLSKLLSSFLFTRAACPNCGIKFNYPKLGKFVKPRVKISNSVVLPATPTENDTITIAPISNDKDLISKPTKTTKFLLELNSPQIGFNFKCELNPNTEQICQLLKNIVNQTYKLVKESDKLLNDFLVPEKKIEKKSSESTLNNKGTDSAKESHL